MAPMEPTSAQTISEVESAQEHDQAPQLGPRFEDFFELHYVRLFRALWLIARDRSEAEDVMQEAFMRLWERWDRVSGLEDPAGYLYRTAMNVLRSRRRRALVALRRAVIEPFARDELAAVEGRDVVRRALASLTPRQRAVVILLHVLDLSSAEAAAALGIRPSTVRVLAGRARTTLKRELEEADGHAG
jgi:RNA polymerase sigma-70 factor (ECF subfamily)